MRAGGALRDRSMPAARRATRWNRSAAELTRPLWLLGCAGLVHAWHPPGLAIPFGAGRGGQLERFPLSLDLVPVGLDVRGTLVGRPAEHTTDQLSDVLGRGSRRVAGEHASPGAVREHVVDRHRHLVAGGEHGLGPQVRQSRYERFAEARVLGNELDDVCRLGAVASDEVVASRRRDRAGLDSVPILCPV